MKLIVDRNNVILGIHEQATQEPYGIDTNDGNVYLAKGLSIVDVDSVPEGFTSGSHKYINGEYVVNEELIQQKVQEAIDDYTLELLAGGLIV